MNLAIRSCHTLVVYRGNIQAQPKSQPQLGCAGSKHPLQTVTLNFIVKLQLQSLALISNFKLQRQISNSDFFFILQLQNACLKT